VLAGTPTLHTLEGSRELATGEVVACLRGRRGAHRLEDESDQLARVLIVSTQLMPEIVEYPERDKGGGVFVMTEPPYTGAPYDEARGRVLRLFWRDDGLPIPPTSPPRALPTLADLPPTECGLCCDESKLLDFRNSPLGAFRAFRVVGGR
jgi:hypothetical protein